MIPEEVGGCLPRRPPISTVGTDILNLLKMQSNETFIFSIKGTSINPLM